MKFFLLELFAPVKKKVKSKLEIMRQKMLTSRASVCIKCLKNWRLKLELIDQEFIPMLFAILSRHICSIVARIYGFCRNYWDIPIFQLRKFIPTFWTRS
jgi:hypothetical protein